MQTSIQLSAPRPTCLIARKRRTRLSRVVERPGRWDAPKPCVTAPTMTANDPTPCNGENVSGEQFDYETVGKELLRWELERIGNKAKTECLGLSYQLQSGGDVDRDDYEQLLGLMEDLGLLAQLVERGLDEEGGSE